MIKELTSLRFILILVIFFHHALPNYPGGGDMGVACFFVLSGFCYALGYGRKVKAADFDYRGFIKSRLAKFYPLHWITLLIAIPISLHLGLGWKMVLFWVSTLCSCRAGSRCHQSITHSTEFPGSCLIWCFWWLFSRSFQECLTGGPADGCCCCRHRPYTAFFAYLRRQTLGTQSFI